MKYFSVFGINFSVSAYNLIKRLEVFVFNFRNDFTEEGFIRFNALSIAVVVLIIVDYILTYFGIYHYQVIAEGNPFMVWLMELPFHLGILLRFYMASVIYAILRVAFAIRFEYCFGTVYLYHAIYFYIMVLHIRWIAVVMQ